MRPPPINWTRSMHIHRRQELPRAFCPRVEQGALSSSVHKLLPRWPQQALHESLECILLGGLGCMLGSSRSITGSMPQAM